MVSSSITLSPATVSGLLLSFLPRSYTVTSHPPLRSTRARTTPFTQRTSFFHSRRSQLPQMTSETKKGVFFLSVGLSHLREPAELAFQPQEVAEALRDARPREMLVQSANGERAFLVFSDLFFHRGSLFCPLCLVRSFQPSMNSL